MKTWKLVITIVLGSLNLFAHSFVGDTIDQSLDVVYSYYKDTWIMGLSDGSSWQLMPLKEKRKQTWTEWVRQNEPKEWLLPDEFFFDPQGWMGKYKVEVSFASDSLSSRYNYILTNQTTGQRVFAQFIAHGSHFVPKVEYAMSIIDKAASQSSSILGVLQFTDNILVLKDRSSWKLNLMQKNSPSWSQWWNNEELDQPDEVFITDLNDWQLSDKIEIHHASFENNDLFEKYGVSKLEQEAVLIENVTRKKMAYANPVSFGHLLNLFEQHTENQKKQAYTKGYWDGYGSGKKDGESVGYQKGYRDGQTDKEKIILN